MFRYHKKIYFPDNSKEKLENITDKLNSLDYSFSIYCLDNIKHRTSNIGNTLTFIKNKILDVNDIFEYYTNEKAEIIKVCYRFNYNDNMDIILIVTNIKKIITIYLNSSDDLHYTLKSELYMTS